MEVSVIIPTRDRSELCCRAVRSVLAQQDVTFELIVVDDGSMEPQDTLRALCEKAGGVFLRTKPKGVAAARNHGAGAARGRWLAFLDSDDEWLPGKLRTQLDFHAKYPKYRLSHTEEEWIRNGRFVNPRLIHKKARGEAFAASLKLCCISPSAVVIERTLFEQSGGFDEQLVVCEDYDLWLRLTWQHQVGLIEQPLVRKYGGHPDQLSRSEPAIDRFRVYAIVKMLCESGLDDSLREAALQELQQKASILAAGAKKRSRVEQSRQYASLEAFALSEASRSSVAAKQLFSGLSWLLSREAAVQAEAA